MKRCGRCNLSSNAVRSVRVSIGKVGTEVELCTPCIESAKIENAAAVTRSIGKEEDAS